MTDPPAARVVHVTPERLSGWITRFAERHGELAVSVRPDVVSVLAADGALAAVEVPFPPLAAATDPLVDLIEHALLPRLVGVLLVRKGGHAVGIVRGPKLIGSKVGRGYVQGTTKAGGWSQQRYARRRANQREQAYAEAADVAATLLLPRAGDLAAVVGGGDRTAVRAVLADPRLVPLRALLLDRVLPTPDPRLRVLEAFVDQFRAVPITLNPLA